VDGDKRFALPGPIAAGTYEIRAGFSGADETPAGTLVVPSSGTVIVTCNALFARCSAD
jgi:hypothetical protein